MGYLESLAQNIFFVRVGTCSYLDSSSPVVHSRDHRMFDPASAYRVIVDAPDEGLAGRTPKLKSNLPMGMRMWVCECRCECECERGYEYGCGYGCGYECGGMGARARARARESGIERERERTRANTTMQIISSERAEVSPPPCLYRYRVILHISLSRIPSFRFVVLVIFRYFLGNFV